MRVSVGNPERLMGAINCCDCVLGLGALLTPMARGLHLRKFRYSGGMRGIAGVSALPILLGLFAPMNPDRAAVPPAGGHPEGIRGGGRLRRYLGRPGDRPPLPGLLIPPRRKGGLFAYSFFSSGFGWAGFFSSPGFGAFFLIVSTCEMEWVKLSR